MKNREGNRLFIYHRATNRLSSRMGDKPRQNSIYFLRPICESTVTVNCGNARMKFEGKKKHLSQRGVDAEVGRFDSEL